MYNEAIMMQQSIENFVSLNKNVLKLNESIDAPANVHFTNVNFSPSVSIINFSEKRKLDRNNRVRVPHFF